MKKEFRNGFTMMMAIFLLFAVSAMMAFMVSMSTQTAKVGSDNTRYEQAQLLARSATEYAMLAVSGHDRTIGNGCINYINAQYPSAAQPLFDINISLKYIGLGGIPGCNSFINTIKTPESNGSVLVDVYVRSSDVLDLNEPIAYHKRTLQKP